MHIKISFVGGNDMGMVPKKSDTIMVKNLPSNTTWQSLKDYFRDCGDIKFSEVGSKGFGIIRFASEWDAERAISILFKIVLFKLNKVHITIGRAVT